MDEKETQLVETTEITDEDNNEIATATTNEEPQKTNTTEEIKDKGVNGLAIASMVLGICSFFLYPLICGILAIILGAFALKINNKGRGMALAGIITGICGLGIYMLLMIGIIESFNNIINFTPEPSSTGGSTIGGGSLEEGHNIIDGVLGGGSP